MGFLKVGFSVDWVVGGFFFGAGFLFCVGGLFVCCCCCEFGWNWGVVIVVFILFLRRLEL